VLQKITFVIVKSTAKTGLIFLILLFSNQNLMGQPRFWLKWTNPVYRIHRNITDTQWVKVEKEISNPKIVEKWQDHPVYWHNLTRYFEYVNKYDSAINMARKSCIKADLYFQDIKKAEQFIDRYFFDAKYLKLYYRKLLYDKLYREISDTSLSDNNNLVSYYKEELNVLNNTIPSASDININISLPHILFHIKSKNDTIFYNRVLEINRISNYKAYLAQYQQQIPLNNLNEYPTHLASFLKQVEDTIYNIAWSECLEWDNEQGYLNFTKNYPYSPYKNIALTRADQKGFQIAKEKNTKESYALYLNNYPNGAFRTVASHSLEFLNVIPIPYLNKYGFYRFIDSTSKKRWIDSLFQFAFPFTLKNNINWSSNGSSLINGCALVVNSDKYGTPEYFYIQKDGTNLTTDKFQTIQQFSESLAFATKSGQHGIIDKFGRIILPFKFERILFDINLGKGLFYNGSKWGIFGKSGNVICSPNIDDLNFYNIENTPPTDVIDLGIYPLLVSRINSLEFINQKGEKIIHLEFEEAYPFRTNKTIIKQKDTWTVIDEFGNNLIDFKGNVEPLAANIYSIELNGKYNVLSLTEDTAVILNTNSSGPAVVANYWGNPIILIRRKSTSEIYNTSGILELTTDNTLQVQFEILVGKTTRKRKDLYIWYHPNKRKLIEVSGRYRSTERADWIFLEDGKFTINISDSLFYNDINRDTVISRSNNLVLIRKFAQENYFRGINDSNYVGLINENLEWVIRPKYTDIVYSGTPNLYFVQQDIDSAQSWEVFNTKTNKITNLKFDEIYPNEYPNYILVGKGEKLIWLTSDLMPLMHVSKK